MASKEEKCVKCDKTIYIADRCEKYEGKIYHSRCFICSHADCGIRLTQRSVKGYNKMPYCYGHVPNESLPRRLTLTDERDNNVSQSSSDKPVQQNSLDIEQDLMNNKSEDISFSSPRPTEIIEVDRPSRKYSLRKEMRTILQESSPHMIDEIFSGLSRDMHIIVCGSPRVGKSTLINVLCGREVANAKEGLASVTQSISCYTIEGQCNTGSNIINYKYNYWDTPGFESWDKDNIKSKVQEIIEKPETKPLCMIFCASPGTFVDLTQLEWLLDLCINKRQIFCALVCTNKYAGQEKNCLAALEDFNRLLSKYANDPPRKENDITFYTNIGLCAAVNSEPYKVAGIMLPVSGINELIYGIMESLVDEQVLHWCFMVLENQEFWNNCHEKVARFLDGAKGKMKAIRKFIDGKDKQKVKIESVTYSTK